MLLLVIVALIAGTGWYVWNSKKNSDSSLDKAATTEMISSSKTILTKPDPYKGWKEICDDYKGYCFKYPEDWIIESNDISSTSGDSGGVALLNPTKTVLLNYSNINNRDGSEIEQHIVSLEKLNDAGQSLAIAGTYYTVTKVIGDATPQLSIYDTELFNNHISPVVGEASKFPNNPVFVNKGAGAPYYGSLVLSSAIPVPTENDAKAWFNKDEVKTGLLIIKSFRFKG